MSNERMKHSSSDRLAGPVIKALGIHLAVVLLLFVSFSSAPEFEPAKPIVQATLVQLNSKSPATTQTDQRIAGEAERTAAQRHEAEELKKQQQKQEQEQAAARAAEQRQAEAAAAAARETEQKAAQEQKTAAERRQAEQVEKQKAEEARRADAARKLAEAEAAKKQAEAEAAKKQAEEARRKTAEEAKRKEDEAKRRAAEETKRKADAEAKVKAEADRVAKLKREQEEARAKALADLLAEETQYQRAQADQVGDQVAASFDDVIRRYVSEQWRRPPTARNGMMVEVRISMLPSGDITDAVVTRSSGDAGFDQSAVQAVRNVGRIPEMQQLSRDDPAAFDRMYRQRTLRFKPEDLDF